VLGPGERLAAVVPGVDHAPIAAVDSLAHESPAADGLQVTIAKKNSTMISHQHSVGLSRVVR
jgi:hypothetical protein